MAGMMRPFALLLLVLCGCATTYQPSLVAPPDTHTEAPPTFFRNVRVFDGIDDFLREPMDVLVVGGRVVGLASTGLHEPPEGVEVVEGTGMTLLPGLVDTHVRLGGTGVPWAAGLDSPEAQVEALLYAGVTSVVVAGHDADLARLQRAIADGRVAGPRLHRASQMIVARDSDRLPKGASRQVLRPFRAGTQAQSVDAPLGAARTARRDLEYRDADFVLVDASSVPEGTPGLEPATLRALVAEARQYDKQVCALAAGPEDAARASEAGVALLLQPPWESVFTDEQLHRIATKGTPVVTTLQTFLHLEEALAGERPSGALEEAVLAAGEPAREPPPELIPADRATVERARASVQENLHRLRESGVPLLVGTGAGTPGTLHGASIHDEMEALVAMGWTPSEVLYMATSAPVRFLDPQARFGIIAPGAYADLLLVEGDPTRDITATRAIVGVWQAGRRIERLAPGGR